MKDEKRSDNAYPVLLQAEGSAYFGADRDLAQAESIGVDAAT